MVPYKINLRSGILDIVTYTVMDYSLIENICDIELPRRFKTGVKSDEAYNYVTDVNAERALNTLKILPVRLIMG